MCQDVTLGPSLALSVSMYPRKRLDISWNDMTAGVAGCLVPTDAEFQRGVVESLWSPGGEAFACLSIRTGFDLLLRALELPPDSEVLVSAITIPHMVDIIEHHGLVPVPVDVDTRTLQLRDDQLEAAVTPRTRAILIAHVFGSRMDLTLASRVAQRHNLLLIEDCAQAWVADRWRGSPAADVSMFSFGTIKTETAFGGAVFTVRRPELRARLGAFSELLPRRRTGAYLRRLLKHAGLKAASDSTAVYAGLLKAIAASGHDPDQVIMAASRGFSGPDFWRLIRQRPSAALLRLLERRLRSPRPGLVAGRKEVGDALVSRLHGVEVVGAGAPNCTWWLFPVVVRNREAVRQVLSHHGYDATLGSTSLTSVSAPEGRAQPWGAHRAMRNVLYVPLGAEMTPSDLDRLASVLNDYALPVEAHDGHDARRRQAA